MNRILLFITLSIFIVWGKPAKATHLMGGEITWECAGNGDYIFTVKVYRDCSGNTIPPETSGAIQIHNYPNASQVTQIPKNNWVILSGKDISPDCPSSSQNFSCANKDPESVYEYVRTFRKKLNGTPPPAGWIITYDDYARNNNDNISNANGKGVTLRAKILPHAGTVADSCIDNSPKFREVATSLVCSGQPFRYNHNATDAELDSLVYEWAKPLDNVAMNQLFVEGVTPSALAFKSGYTYNSPFPGITQDSRNIPATLDPNTGEINLTSYTTGKYVSVVKVTAYKCQEPVAEVYRELQSNLANSSLCSANDKPSIRPPFRDASGQYTRWNDTVKAGDLVNFSIRFQDPASVAQNGGDSLRLTATGFQFGDNYTSSTSGCLNPPCATLNTSLPMTSFVTGMANFSWQTGCNHTSFTDFCVSGQNTYSFVFTVEDDVCPLPQKNIATISITVLADSVIESPLIRCVDVLPNGDVDLSWNPTIDTNNSFSAWMIYSATDENGPYTLVDSVKTYSQSSYTHTGANADQQRRWYYMRSRSGCDGIVQNVARDTVSTIFLKPIIKESCLGINWNPLSKPNPMGADTNYSVYREFPIGSGFQLLTQTSADSLCDTLAACSDSVAYRLELNNRLESCLSRSNVIGFSFDRKPNTKFDLAKSYCVGDTVHFDNLTTAIGGSPTYSWDFGDGSTSNAKNPKHYYTGSGPYTVELTASNGSGCDSTFRKQVVLGPVAAAGSDQNVCAGDSVQIGGTSSGRGSLTYSWRPAASLSDAGIQKPKASPAVTTDYILTVTDSAACSTVDTMIVTVVPIPTADAGGDKTICEGSDVRIGGAPTGPPGATYSWNNATSLDNASAANPKANPTTTTTYTVTVTVAANCFDTDQVRVEVNPAVNVDAGPDKTICEGSDVQLDGSATGGTGSKDYSWTPGTALSDTTVLNPIASPSQTTIYTLTVRDSLGCKYSDQVTVTVNDRPVPDFTYSNPCSGQQTAFSDLSAVNNGNVNAWSWDFGDGSGTSNQQNPTYTYASNGSYTVVLRATSSLGCIDSISKNVNIVKPPKADAGADRTICNRDTLQIGAASNSGVVYAWDNAATLTNATISNPKAFPSTTTTYTLIATDTASGCTDTAAVKISVNAVPSASFTVQDTCFGSSTKFDGSPSGASSYRWDFGDNSGSSNQENPGYTYSNSGTYTVKLVVENANACLDSISKDVTIAPLPTADAGPDKIICNRDSVQIGTAAITGYTYAWSNAATLSNANISNPTAFPSSAETYTVTVTETASGCVNTDQVKVDVNLLPLVDAGPDQLVCKNDSVQIGTPAVAGNSYSWTPAAGLSDAKIAQPLASPKDTTAYVLSIADANSCVAKDTVLVAVKPLPIPDFKVEEMCLGNYAAFKDLSTITDGSINYWEWDFGDGNGSSRLQNPAYQYSAAGKYKVKLIVAADSLCKDSIIKEIEVFDLPNIDVGNDVTICLGDSVSLGGKPTGPAGATYSWSPATALSSVVAENPKAYPINSTTYKLTVTDDNGCSNYDSVEVEVNPLPDVVAGPDTAVCQGSNIQLEAKGAISYEWTPETYLDNSKIANPIASPKESMVYVVEGTDLMGCVNTDTVKIEVFDLALEPADTVVCYGDSLQLKPQVYGSTDGLQYYWSPDIGIDNVNAAMPMVSPPISKYYYLTIRNAQACEEKDSIYVEVNTRPNLNFEYNLSARCSGAVLELRNRSANTAEYEWFLNGQSRSKAYEPTFEVDHQKENRLVLKGRNNDCEDSLVKIIPSHSFDELMKLNKVNAFSPNGDGINDLFSPVFDGEFVNCAGFTIYDRWGAKVFDTNIGQYGWDGRTLDGKKAPEGTYYYVINFAGKEIKGSVYLSR